MNAFCEMCKLLNNPLRLEMLLRIYDSSDGMNVGVLADQMMSSGLGMSGVSQYLKQLERIGVLRRVRAGQYVNYVADLRHADPKVREAIKAIVEAERSCGRSDFSSIFAALMNPFRAEVIVATSKAGEISGTEICARTLHQIKRLKRDLQDAIDAGLLVCSDSDPENAVYRYCRPSNQTAQHLIDILASDLY